MESCIVMVYDSDSTERERETRYKDGVYNSSYHDTDLIGLNILV